MKRSRTRTDDLDDTAAFDVAVGRPIDDPDGLAAALTSAGVEARVVTHTDDDRVVKIRHQDLPAIQEALERRKR